MKIDPVSNRLTQNDVARLMADPSAEVRVEITAKIAMQFEIEAFGPAERQIAEDIFRMLVKDVEVRVRETLASHLKNSSDLPHDVAVALAGDVDSVSLPMIRFSEVLTVEDLINIVCDQSEAKQVAVAKRSHVSTPVADALVDTGNETAIARLVANEGAMLTEQALGRIMEDYQASPAISDSLSRRPFMPASVSAQLVDVLSKRLQDLLLQKHDASQDVASDIILQARERATVSLADGGSTDAELEKLVEQLARKERLSASLLLRSLCMGDMGFFERALARLARLPLQNARILIHDHGGLGLESVYMKADLPKRLYPAFRAIIELSDETDYDGGQNDRSRFIERLLERILTQFEDPQSRMTQEDIDYLMDKLAQVAA